ncbi:Polyketide cyclase/dehydrase and lipid transporter [Apiospora saccharicola]|uniref:Polyketide cyclase/dehydrase and lipid transporter n=1 Tax=Apiospora saccharicola TaxID=335842 RepID=A0ABR1TLR9_9PEZI
MATTSLRPCAQRLARNAPRAIAAPWTPATSYQTRRGFLNIPGLSMPDANAPPQHLTARRTLPYASDRLYEIIADIDSYPRFLPYCAAARVTHWTNPPPASSPSPGIGESTRRWPTQADLTAGWGGLQETYTSRVFCVPGSIVEAISGEAGPEIPAAELARLGLRDPGPRAGIGGRGGVFKSLVTRWTVRPLPSNAADATTTGAPSSQIKWSEVEISLRYRFSNPLYAAVSSAVADKLAPIMVDAFVKEAERLLGNPRR